MPQLSPAGQTAIQDMAQRHGFSYDAVVSMLDAVINGNGSQAQFSHPEFGGSGQWMKGGMTMVGDMFNGYLKSRVANLCADLSNLIASQPGLVRTGSFQSQSQGGNSSTNSWGDPAAYKDNDNNLFMPPPPDWWGPDLRHPNSSGGQNGMRYAWFNQAHRLAMEVNGQVIVYDTLDHQISGVSQQQSGGYSVTFSSQYGYVDVSQLPVVTVNGVPPAPKAPAPSYSSPAPSLNPVNNSGSNSGSGSGSSNSGDVFASLEKLAALQARGIVTEQEYAAKKAELLSRL